MGQMDRRDFVKAAVWGGALLGGLLIAKPGIREQAGEKSRPRTAIAPQSMTPLEARHVPKIELAKGLVTPGEDLQVTITVDHPMKEDHHISQIDLFIDSIKIGTHTLRAEAMKASLTVVLTPQVSFDLVVQSQCNIHGWWENRVPVRVT